MKSCVAALLLLPALACAGGDLWLTIVGEPERADVDTIQFNPIPVSVQGPLRVMTVRVSRSEERMSGDGIRFRSFSGLVEFNCERQQARFASSQFYDEPLWRSPSRFVKYPPTDVRPMAFRKFEPNPSERVIRAACSIDSASYKAPRQP